METIKLKTGNKLIIDPCYIKKVTGDFGAKEWRFDGLKCVKTLYEGDDGCYTVDFGVGTGDLGVDSGRIWVLEAEFDIVVDIDAGFSGYILAPEDVALKDIKLRS